MNLRAIIFHNRHPCMLSLCSSSNSYLTISGWFSFAFYNLCIIELFSHAVPKLWKWIPSIQVRYNQTPSLFHNFGRPSPWLIFTWCRSTLTDELQLCPFCSQPFSGKLKGTRIQLIMNFWYFLCFLGCQKLLKILGHVILSIFNATLLQQLPKFCSIFLVLHLWFLIEYIITTEIFSLEDKNIHRKICLRLKNNSKRVQSWAKILNKLVLLEGQLE